MKTANRFFRMLAVMSLGVCTAAVCEVKAGEQPPCPKGEAPCPPPQCDAPCPDKGKPCPPPPKGDAPCPGDKVLCPQRGRDRHMRGEAPRNRRPSDMLPPAQQDRKPGRKFSKAPENKGKEPVRRTWMRIRNRLSAEECTAMLALQKESPEKFAEAVMKKKDELQKAAKERFEKMRNLAKLCRESTGEDLKKYKDELTVMAAEDFKVRMSHSRRMLEDMKKTVERLEKDIAERESKADEIVAKRVERMINAPIRKGKKL